MKINASFKDKRGQIFDIFVNSPKDHCALITSKKGAVRGNHFHKKAHNLRLYLTVNLGFTKLKLIKKVK